MGDEITQELALRCLRYDPLTGVLRHRERSDRSESWNARYAGEVAGGKDGSAGYLKIKVNGQQILQHRLIWLMQTGEWPEQIDHIDRDRENNKWENLREVSQATNNHNRKYYTKSTTFIPSGHKGVSFNRSSGKWAARRICGGQHDQRRLGQYSDLNDAIYAVRQDLEDRGIGLFGERPAVPVKYFDPEIPKLGCVDGSDWVDLYVNDIVPNNIGLHVPAVDRMDGEAFDVSCPSGMPFSVKVMFGVAMELPPGKEAQLVPRSSTFKNYGMILANSMGIIDNSFAGPSDQWFANWMCWRPFEMDRWARIAQFRIVDKMKRHDFIENDLSHNVNRGGEGSTGVK